MTTYNQSTQTYMPINSPSMQSSTVATTVPAFPTIQEQLPNYYQPTYQPAYQPTYQPTYQQTYQPTYQPTYQQTYQPVPVYMVNNIPYYCFPQQPNILYPAYCFNHTVQQEQAAVGDTVEGKLNSLENYVNNMEQQ